MLTQKDHTFEMKTRHPLLSILGDLITGGTPKSWNVCPVYVLPVEFKQGTLPGVWHEEGPRLFLF